MFHILSSVGLQKRHSALRIAIVACALSALLPLSVHAMETTALDLRSIEEQQVWRATNSFPRSTEGVRFPAGVGGSFIRPLTNIRGFDAIRLTYVSPTGGTVMLLWQSEGAPPDQYHQMPITIAPRTTPDTVVVPLDGIQNWVRSPAMFGIGLDGKTDVTVRSVELLSWSAGERLLESVRCFWTLDGWQLTSINYLWGPLLCSTPISRETLYNQSPPLAQSGMRWIYAVLVIGALVIGWKLWHRGERGVFLRRFLVLAFACWVLLDMRMGAQAMRNWWWDIELYLRPPIGQRLFRSLGYFPDFARETRKLFTAPQRYVFLAPQPWPYTNYIRYETYPSMPVTPAEGSGALYWLAYKRPDLTLDPEGKLLENGQAISPPGSIIHEFMKGTFVFKVKVPSPQ